MRQIVGVPGIIGPAPTVQHIGPEAHARGLEGSTALRQARSLPRESRGRTVLGLRPSRAKRPRAMTHYKSDLLSLLDERGYIHQTTTAEGLDALTAQPVVPGSMRFHATAPTLPLGRLVQPLLPPRLHPPGHTP